MESGRRRMTDKVTLHLFKRALLGTGMNMHAAKVDKPVKAPQFEDTKVEKPEETKVFKPEETKVDELEESDVDDPEEIEVDDLEVLRKLALLSLNPTGSDYQAKNGSPRNGAKMTSDEGTNSTVVDKVNNNTIETPMCRSDKYCCLSAIFQSSEVREFFSRHPEFDATIHNQFKVVSSVRCQCN